MYFKITHTATSKIKSCKREATTICPNPCMRRTLQPSSSPYTPGQQRPARLASSSCGCHEYSRCTRQMSDRQTLDSIIA